ncbi:MAG: 2OG-Fe(II) oxygenase [Lysobacterales bacterium]
MFQIQNHQTLVPDRDELKALRQGFARDHFIHLHQLIEASLLAAIGQMIDSQNFDERLTPTIGCVERCKDPRIDNGFSALLNHPQVRDTISAIVNQPIDLWGGNTVRRIPGKNHFSAWHNDKHPPFQGADGHQYQRVVPLSLNISEGLFDGGNLEMRSVPDHTLLADIANPVPGDGLLFEISEGLQHRVADVTGGVPRMVHVGWFHHRVG